MQGAIICSLMTIVCVILYVSEKQNGRSGTFQGICAIICMVFAVISTVLG